MKKLWVLATLVLVLLGGCCGEEAEKSLRQENEKLLIQIDSLKYGKTSDLESFIDNTSTYAGDTVTLRLVLVSPVFIKKGSSLLDNRGKVAEFRPFIPDSTMRPWRVGEENLDLSEFKIQIKIPDSLPVPRAGFGHKLLVKFLCTEGDLLKGNVALEIRRFKINHRSEIEVSPPPVAENIKFLLWD